MKIKAYAICNMTRKGKVYARKDIEGCYFIFEKKKDAKKYLEGTGEFIELATVEVGE